MKRTGVLSERIAISAVAVHGRAELLSVEVLTQLADLKAMFAHDLRPRPVDIGAYLVEAQSDQTSDRLAGRGHCSGYGSDGWMGTLTTLI